MNKKNYVLSKPVSLIGMMGTGKSYIGKKLGSALGCPFYDSDMLIEKKAGCSIGEIFARDGEEKFRTVEAQTIQDLLKINPSVIATGGGAVTNPAMLEALLRESLCVWIDSDVESIYERVKNNNKRPLLQTENPKETLEKILAERKAIYGQAHLVVDNSASDYETVVKTILKALN